MYERYLDVERVFDEMARNRNLTDLGALLSMALVVYFVTRRFVYR